MEVGMEYEDFIISKRIKHIDSGFEVGELNHWLFDFQKDIVRWAIRKGRAAIFSGCGTGKSIMQLEWAHHVVLHTNKPVLILAPLAVNEQTKREGEKFGIEVTICESQEDVKNGINITNYEKLHKFVAKEFDGIVLDESSILKSFSGKYRNDIIENFQHTPYKLACTATPSPNDFMELGNHSEFLNVMSRMEMLSMFFVHDGGSTQDWYLKGHAEHKFWEWVSSWAVMLDSPKDLGYEEQGFDLPPVEMIEHTVESSYESTMTTLFASSLTDRMTARKESIGNRVKAAADIANSLNKPCLIWCGYNNESEQLAKLCNDSVEIAGKHDNEYKAKNMLEFSEGKIKTLVTKAKIAGFGMNWQVCDTMIFCGLSDSYEQFYQAMRRCWRFGQKNKVKVHIIISAKECSILGNIKRKEHDMMEMQRNMIHFTSDIQKEHLKSIRLTSQDYETKHDNGTRWESWQGDSVELIKNIETESIDYSIFSPPFASLYTYSNSERDMGNCKTTSEFYDHFQYLIKELFRVIKQGRLLSFHCMNLPTSKQRDGFIGISDFRGDLIKMFEKEGFIYHSEAVIWKNPVVAMQRTKALGLIHKTIRKDSSMARQGIPDYLVTMRKPGENKEFIPHTHEEFPVDNWQIDASPTWESSSMSQRYLDPVLYDINPSNTLNRGVARDEKDEKHICPLQLDLIEMAIRLWTNKDDVVFTPFGGIGSEGYQSVKMGRKAKLMELKKSYYNVLVKNMRTAESEDCQETLFDTFNKTK